MQRFTEGFRGYVAAMLICLLGVFVFLLVTPQSREEHIPRIDYSIDVANMRRDAPYRVWTPEPVPADWIPTSSRKTAQRGVVTWRLGFATAKGADGEREHVMLAQSDEKPAAGFADRMANSDRALGTVPIAGAVWEKRQREDKDQRSLVRILPDCVIVVTGTAGWDELTAFAGSLKQQPKVTS
ncbi:DUF4245 domain-containing protein [Planomonospora sp. ID82291]|uniref:DUF4245 domain-containing protein n=1 Tax=Planomonospora sp. ID82291 TaxID=2738136 RepID=UPI0018C3DFDB|nr:DUF4245 domain-containing protein [Planomonospora sp. ID82291]MBG0815043.1 DUF4245 domain-containing protein [Planomonospora sp. ID82291]